MNGFAHKPWNEIASFPRDGSTVEIRDANGDVWLARWQNNLIWIDSDSAVQPTHWRAL